MECFKMMYNFTSVLKKKKKKVEIKAIKTRKKHTYC